MRVEAGDTEVGVKLVRQMGHGALRDGTRRRAGINISGAVPAEEQSGSARRGRERAELLSDGRKAAADWQKSHSSMRTKLRRVGAMARSMLIMEWVHALSHAGAPTR